MNKYIYDGPVMLFDVCIVNNWRGETYAASQAKAKSNLAFQFKCANKQMANSKITLPGKLIIV